MSCSPEHIAKQIREKGFRLTNQRMAILNVLHGAGHLSPTDVFERVTQVMPDFTEPTVYRTLDFLAETGFVKATHAGAGRMAYELEATQHHHLNCKKCGNEMQIGHEELMRFYEQLELETGFRVTEEHITFAGLCPHCKD